MAAGTFSGRESRALGGIRESKSSMEPTPIVPSISRCWAGVFEMYRMALVSARGDELLVVGRRHEAVHLLRIAELDDDHPALALSPSSLAHSCSLVYRRSAGTFAIMLS